MIVRSCKGLGHQKVLTGTQDAFLTGHLSPDPFLHLAYSEVQRNLSYAPDVWA